MIDDVLAALPAAMTAMARSTGQWTCLGVIDRREDIESIRDGLGNGFELTTERLDANLSAAGSHPWVRSRPTWEVWARAVETA